MKAEEADHRLAPPVAVEAAVREKTEFFTSVQLWPGHVALNPDAWLENFSEDDRLYALNLLNVFIYINEHLAAAMLRSGFEALSQDVCAVESLESSAWATQWTNFCSRTIATYPQGERPHITDSGIGYARRVRQILGIPQHRIVPPDQALSLYAHDHTTPIVFFDDFVGSGSQMAATWRRYHKLANGQTSSYAEEAQKDGAGALFYVPLIATATGMRTLRSSAPSLKVRPTHIIDHRYSLLSPDCILWPDELKEGGREFIERASKGLGIGQWRGFRGLALGLAFWNSVPDATLPIFYWEDAWNPLIRRS